MDASVHQVRLDRASARPATAPKERSKNGDRAFDEALERRRGEEHDGRARTPSEPRADAPAVSELDADGVGGKVDVVG